MNILYLAHRIPYPPDKGDKMRAYRHLAHLTSRHNVWCACFVDAREDERHVAVLRGMCRGVAAVRLNRRAALLRGAVRMLRGGTITEGFYDHPAMRRAVEELTGRVSIDVVVAFSSGMASYALSVPAERRVLDMCDLDSAKWLDYARYTHGPMRAVYAWEGRRLAERERAWAEAFDATTVITGAESADLRRRVPRARVFVATNGVDEAADESHCRSRGDVAVPEADARPTVGFVGVMDYFPNVEGVCGFVRDCWPAIRAAHPQAEFRVVGRRPTRAVRRLGRVPGVSIVGEVADVGAELRSFDVSVAPLNIARGLQNKVLEAMAFGVPVVASAVAARGIEARDSEDFLIARDSSEMVRHINGLLRNETECRRLGESGRRFVAAHHAWSDALRRFELIVTGEQRRDVERDKLASCRTECVGESSRVVRSGKR